MRQKTLKDVVEEDNKVYEGKFWNRHIQDFQEWDEQRDWYRRLQSFCNRMYLDYSDETSSPHATRLEQHEYESTYESWLVKKFLEKEKNGTS
jgi:hypothetical protein